MADTPAALFDNPAAATAREAELQRRQELEDLRAVLQTPAGRRFVWRLLTRSHVFAQPFSPDPYVSAFASGERAFGVKLLSDLLTHTPELFMLCRKEAYDD